MTKTNKNTLKNVWKKPLGLLLSLSILASTSNTCFADEKPNNAESKAELIDENQMQLKTEQAAKLFTKEDLRMSEEEFAIFKHKLRFEESLDPGTREYLFMYGVRILERQLSVEDENLIKEIDDLLKKKFLSGSISKEDSEKLWLLMLKLIQPDLLKK